MTLLLNNDEVKEILTMDDCLEVLEETFVDLAQGRAVNRPRSHSYIPLESNTFYLFKSMDGGVPRYGIHALRLSSDILKETVEQGMQRRIKLPAAPGNKWLGLVFLFDIHSGELLAILQDGYLQRMRVGATSGLAAKYLSREDSSSAGLLGTGWQAGAQVMALCRVRRIAKIKVFSPNYEHRKNFCQEWSQKLGIVMEPVEKAKEAVRNVDILVAATNSLQPVFDSAWLEAGMHVNSVQGRELDAQILDRCDVIVVRSREEPTNWIMGQSIPVEVKRAKKFSPEHEKKVRELGAVIAGKIKGRTASQQITLFGGGGMGGSAGLGVQFAAVAFAVYRKAMHKGLGRELPTDWFLEDIHP